MTIVILSFDVLPDGSGQSFWGVILAVVHTVRRRAWQVVAASNHRHGAHSRRAAGLGPRSPNLAAAPLVLVPTRLKQRVTSRCQYLQPPVVVLVPSSSGEASATTHSIEPIEPWETTFVICMIALLMLHRSAHWPLD